MASANGYVPLASAIAQPQATQDELLKSPHNVGSASAPMGRKRTIDLSSTIYASEPMSSRMSSSGASSSPQVSRFDANGSTSSPFDKTSVSTVSTSPELTRAEPKKVSLSSPEGTESDSDDEDWKPSSRPDMKRRKTAPGALVSPSRLEGRKHRISGKDGEDIWSADLEEAFERALALLPMLGKKKIIVGNKPCGRNELIANYIQRTTGKTRTRKQVSSHVQVLKKMKKNDANFMAKVSDSGVENPTFTRENAIAFFGELDEAQKVLSRGIMSRKAPPPLARSVSHQQTLLSPYSTQTMQRSYSTSSATSLHLRQTPHRRLSDSPASQQWPMTPINQPMSAPMSATSSLTNALNDLHFPMPPVQHSSPIPCPIGPSRFALWTQVPGRTDRASKFGLCKFEQDAASLLKTVYLEDLPLHDLKYPGLLEMHDRLPCQFLHVQLNLGMPYEGATLQESALHAYLNITSAQNLPLTAVTTIYSFGTRVLQVTDVVQPASPNSHVKSFVPTRNHAHSYNVPFAEAFWSHFFKGSFDPDVPPEGEQFIPSYAKTGIERSEFTVALSGLSVVQELVVASEDAQALKVNGEILSPGSALGDVVLVTVFDFQCVEPRTGGGEVSFFSMRKPSASGSPLPSPALGNSANEDRVDDFSRQASSHPRSNQSSIPPRTMQRAQAVGQQEIRQRLYLDIPPLPRQFTPVYTDNLSPLPQRSTISPHQGHPHHIVYTSRSLVSVPHTPWPQLIHTPTMPPPAGPASFSEAQRERLEQHWAQQSTSTWDLESPALMGVFPPSAQTRAFNGYPDPHLQNAAVHTIRQDMCQPYSTALDAVTAQAMAAGTPMYEQVPSATRQVFDAPFSVHPSHHYAPDVEELESQKLVASDLPERETKMTSEPREAVHREQQTAVQTSFPSTYALDTKHAVNSVKSADSDDSSIRASPQATEDYFSNLFGATRYT